MNTPEKVEAKGVPKITPAELAQLGGGMIAYIKKMTSEEALRLFPEASGLPEDAILYVLQSADGSPLMITDSRDAAIGQAIEGKLAVASVH